MGRSYPFTIKVSKWLSKNSDESILEDRTIDIVSAAGIDMVQKV